MTTAKFEEMAAKLHTLNVAIKHSMVNNKAQVKTHVTEAENHLVNALRAQKNIETYNAEVYHAARELLAAAAWAKRQEA